MSWDSGNYLTTLRQYSSVSVSLSTNRGEGKGILDVDSNGSNIFSPVRVCAWDADPFHYPSLPLLPCPSFPSFLSNPLSYPFFLSLHLSITSTFQSVVFEQTFPNAINGTSRNAASP